MIIYLFIYWLNTTENPIQIELSLKLRKYGAGTQGRIEF